MLVPVMKGQLMQILCIVFYQRKASTELQAVTARVNSDQRTSARLSPADTPVGVSCRCSQSSVLYREQAGEQHGWSQ